MNLRPETAQDQQEEAISEFLAKQRKLKAAKAKASPPTPSATTSATPSTPSAKPHQLSETDIQMAKELGWM